MKKGKKINYTIQRRKKNGKWRNFIEKNRTAAECFEWVSLQNKKKNYEFRVIEHRTKEIKRDTYQAKAEVQISSGTNPGNRPRCSCPDCGKKKKETSLRFQLQKQTRKANGGLSGWRCVQAGRNKKAVFAVYKSLYQGIVERGADLPTVNIRIVDVANNNTLLQRDTLR